MNGRSGIFKFFIFLFFLVIVLFQVLSMMQAERLYERLESLIKHLQSMQRPRPAALSGGTVQSADDFTGAGNEANEGDWLVWCLSAEPATLNEIIEASTWSTRWEIYSRV